MHGVVLDAKWPCFVMLIKLQPFARNTHSCNQLRSDWSIKGFPGSVVNPFLYVTAQTWLKLCRACYEEGEIVHATLHAFVINRSQVRVRTTLTSHDMLRIIHQLATCMVCYCICYQVMKCGESPLIDLIGGLVLIGCLYQYLHWKNDYDPSVMSYWDSHPRISPLVIYTSYKHRVVCDEIKHTCDIFILKSVVLL